jgi:hypothetical protein
VFRHEMIGWLAWGVVPRRPGCDGATQRNPNLFVA